MFLLTHRMRLWDPLTLAKPFVTCLFREGVPPAPGKHTVTGGRLVHTQSVYHLNLFRYEKELLFSESHYQSNFFL